MSDIPSVVNDVVEYYSAKVREHGSNHRGVDWPSEAAQTLRFDQLLRVVDRTRPYSINDYGCGYGALYHYLRDAGDDVQYVGFDLSQDMLNQAQQLHGEDERCRFVDNESDLPVSDYTVVSGIFNVRLGATDEAWTRFVVQTLDTLRDKSTRGFAFNSLTKYSDAEFMRDDLYYPDPAFYFDHCKRNYSRNVALLHDYDLYEFTMLVRL